MSPHTNPGATLIQARSTVRVDDPDLIRGKRVLLIEDGPTLTHGEMAYGSGSVAAHRYGAAEVVDPRPFARGSLIETFQRFPWVQRRSRPWAIPRRSSTTSRRQSLGSIATPS